jgi:single-strand DNA-binding protein
MSISGIECAFIARAGGDPEVKTSQAGKPWASLSACVGENDDAQWVRIAVFGAKATSLQVAKGDRIYVEGRLKLETWTSREGQPRSGLKVAAWKCEPIGAIGNNKRAKPKDEEGAPAQSNGGDRPQGTRDWQRPGPVDDEIPFHAEWRG